MTTKMSTLEGQLAEMRAKVLDLEREVEYGHHYMTTLEMRLMWEEGCWHP